MNRRIGKISLVAALTLLTIGSVGAIVGFTIAGYERSQIVKKTGDSPLTIGGEGVRKTTLTLNMNNIWSASDADIYALVWRSENSSDTYIWQKGTVSDDANYYSFNFELTSVNRIQFHRMVPNSTPASFSARDAYDLNGSGLSYNRTNDLDLADRGNSTMYIITGWTQSGNYGYLSPGRWSS